MKNQSRVLFCLFALATISFASSFTFKLADKEIPQQQGKTFFVQFRIIGLETAEQAEQINSEISKKEFINISRTDYVSSSYFAVLKNGSVPHKEQFELILKELGYEISCFSFGEQYKNQLKSPNTLKFCEDE